VSVFIQFFSAVLTQAARGRQMLNTLLAAAGDGGQLL
jgi:hypothetical protein